MKKKILFFMVFLLASLFIVNRVQAEENISLSFYEKTSCVTIESSDKNGVFYATEIGHGDIVNAYFGSDKQSLPITDDTWIHMKGIVSKEIYRIKLYSNGEKCHDRIFDTTSSSGLVKLNSDRTFEIHHKAKDLLNVDSLNKLGFQLYVNGADHDTGSNIENVEFLGIVFNNDKTFSNWATPVEREEHICNWDNEWTKNFTHHWHVCLAGCKTKNNYEAHSYVEGICSVCGSEEPGELSFGVMSTESVNATVENAIAGGTGKVTFIKDGTATISIPVENALPTYHEFLSIKLKTSDGISIKAYVDGLDADKKAKEVYMCENIFTAWNASKYLETYEDFFIANVKIDEYFPKLMSISNIELRITGTTDDVVEIMDVTLTNNMVHNFEVPVPEYDVTYEINGHGEQPENLTKVTALPKTLPVLKTTGYIFEGWYTDAELTTAAVAGSTIKKNTTLYAKWFEGTISNIAVPKGATYQKNAAGEQIITYSKSPGWQTFDIKVIDYDPTNTILEVVFEASSDLTICFQINGNIDWSLGHILRLGERKSKITIDLSSYDYELSSDFTIGLYLDAESVVDKTKTIVFKSITLKTPDPEPEGMYISSPKATGMSCFEGALGDEVIWECDDWAIITYDVNKYEKEYDVLAINMSVIKGMSLGILVNWYEMVNGEKIEKHEYVLDHWGNEGIFTTTGDVELVFLFKSFNLENKNITSITFYFDPPTNTYVPVKGTKTCTIYSVELYKSSELELDTLDIMAEPMSVNYNGKPINFVAENEYDYDMIIEYSINNSNWTKEAPVNAGTYKVRITFMGSLTHDYTVVNSTLTINKVQATVKETDVIVDLETGVVTIAEGIVASTSIDFGNESLLMTGDIVKDNSVIYYYHPADKNHTASEVLSLLVILEKEPTYNVSFVINNHGEQPSILTDVAKLPDLPILTEEGWTFVCWYYETSFNTQAKVGDVVTSNITLFAYWEANEYTIEFDYQLEGYENEIINTKYDEEIILLDLIQNDGYEFLGWNTNADGTGNFYDALEIAKNLTTSGTITLYAIWDQIEYTLTIRLNNGEVNITRTLHYNDDIVAVNEPVKVGYKFEGWYVSGEKFSFENAKMPNSNLVIEAKYIKEVKITYVVDDTIFVVYTGYEGLEIDYEIDNPEKTGYKFEGWYLDVDFTQKFNLTYFPTKDMNVYAKFEVVKPNPFFTFIF